MARLVKFHKKEPISIEVGDKKIWICMCGLSDNYPYCSGKHKFTKDEQEEKLYIYDENYQRMEVEKVLTNNETR
jgi:CDGSH-type Zn-finger protein